MMAFQYRKALLLLAALITAPVAGHSQNPSASQPVVVELFTSQGCSSCPPADAVLSTLAQRSDVLALSFHVDYWNHIGWEDPFSDPKFTRRQTSYNTSLRSASNYTPQVVVNGTFETVGNNEKEINDYITQAAKAPGNIRIMAHNSGNSFWVKIPDTKPAADAPLNLWLIGYDRKHITPVSRGENKGRTLKNTNVVRYLEHIGQWEQAPFAEHIIVPWDSTPDFYAVILQTAKGGAIKAAVTAPFQ